MRHLNYHHLLYFWTIAREGSIAGAAKSLHLTPQTISGQLKLLEESVGEPLFHRVGRGLTLTEVGQVVNQYADEIFALGTELSQRIRSNQTGVPSTLNVGIVNSIPKLIACRILQPAIDAAGSLRIVCTEGSLDQLLGDLAVHRLDLLLSDRQVPTGLNVKAYNHTLGRSAVSIFAHTRIAGPYAADFPRSLHDAPFLLPHNSSSLRRSLDDWFEQIQISPRILAEFDDSALLKAFGEAGVGLFPAPTAIATEVESMYDAKRIGDIESVRETFYAISPERKLKHPAVRQVTEAARAHLGATD
ncbi:MAG: transcriptional activator NhaR [Pseudomonadota bacterium]